MDIGAVFNRLPNDIDAVSEWPGGNLVHFFKDGNYWQFDYSYWPPPMTGSGLLSTNWRGVPSNVDAALHFSIGNAYYTYFFKNHQFYALNEAMHTVCIDCIVCRVSSQYLLLKLSILFSGREFISTTDRSCMVRLFQLN